MKSWKKRTLQASLLTVFATMSLGAVSASAADQPASEAKPTTAAAPLPGKWITLTKSDSQASTSIAMAPVVTFAAGTTGASLFSQPALERNYWKMLADTYAPETAADWRKALDDRKQVQAQFPAPAAVHIMKAPQLKEGSAVSSDETVTLQPSPIASTDAVFVTEAKPVAELPALPILQHGEAATISIHALPSDGVAAVKLTQALPIEGVPAGDIMKAEPSEEMVRLQKLAEAVDADDAATIKSLLPQLLQDYIKQTDALRSIVNQIQTEKSADK